jgi:hypothetical protein
MSSWNEDDLRAIAESHDLYISPFREDGITYGTPTLVWPLVVDDEVYVRAANGQQSSWYVAAMNQRAGRIQVGGEDHEVTFERGGNEVASAIDAAYEENTRAAQPCRSCRETGRRQQPCGSRRVEGCPNLLKPKWPWQPHWQPTGRTDPDHRGRRRTGGGVLGLLHTPCLGLAMRRSRRR